MDYSKTTYLTWIKELERDIDAEMRAYWRLVEVRGSDWARHGCLNRADKRIAELEKYRQKLYYLEASQGQA